MYRKAAILFIIILSAVLVSACSKTIAEKVIERQTGGKVKVNTGKGSIELKGKEGTIRIGENKLPDDFPKDVPVYRRAQVKASLGGSGKGGPSFMVTFTTKDSVDAVADYYKGAMAAKGWTEKSNFRAGEGSSKVATLGYEKGGRTVSITVSRSSGAGGETSIVIGTGSKN